MFDALMQKLTAPLIACFHLQIAAGVDAIQIFDSWDGIVAGLDCEATSLKWIRRIVAALPAKFPVILYAKGTAAHTADQASCGVKVLSVDSSSDLGPVRQSLPSSIAVQRNLDPVLMPTTPEIVTSEATHLPESMRGASGHILNLGHGITPQARIACIQALVDTVTGWK